MTSQPIDELAADTREAAFDMSGFWWVWLVSGALWIVAALIVLQFDDASVTTVGVIVGIMFLFAAVEQFVVAVASEGAGRWIALVFGVLLAAAGVIGLVNPEKTFAGIADILGFLFLIVAAMWILRAFVERDENDLWWLGLTAGILMLVLAFWTSGQFFFDKVYLLLVFAGIWALMQGIGDIVSAFAVRRVHKELG